MSPLLPLCCSALNNNVVVRKHTWGLDLGGRAGNATAEGIHAAGGIGGLLVLDTTRPAKRGGSRRDLRAVPAAACQGIGNVGQVLDASDQSAAARYEYDPYGNVIASAGPYAGLNPLRFSTKWWDDEIGLRYWGYRYYSARLGRWMSRDPIGEEGGVNLLAAMRNDPALRFDATGRFVTSPEQEVCVLVAKKLVPSVAGGPVGAVCQNSCCLGLLWPASLSVYAHR